MPPTGEREGARHALLLQKLDLFIDFSVPMEPCPHGGGNKPCCFGVADPLAINAVFQEVTEALREIRRRGPPLPEKQSAAAPAQPGEGEVWDVIAGLLGLIDEWRDETEGRRPPPSASCFECTSGTVPYSLNKGPCSEHRARALLERRGGIGLSGKGER